MLLTRSPLSPDPKVWFSLDLHVLSAPPAFVLSQDQTLREVWIRGRLFRRTSAHESSHFEPLVLKGRAIKARQYWPLTQLAEAGRDRGLDV